MLYKDHVDLRKVSETFLAKLTIRIQLTQTKRINKEM